MKIEQDKDTMAVKITFKDHNEIDEFLSGVDMFLDQTRDSNPKARRIFGEISGSFVNRKLVRDLI